MKEQEAGASLEADQAVRYPGTCSGCGIILNLKQLYECLTHKVLLCPECKSKHEGCNLI